jgi:uncharacterized protein YndB with AHSA1/START domain
MTEMKHSRTVRELTSARIIDAPRALVFEAWTDPRLLALWWGPNDFTNPVVELDVRPGGAIRVDMRGPDGTIYPMRGFYREVVAPERLVFTSTAFEDMNGDPMIEDLNTVTFAPQGERTKLTWYEVVTKVTPAATGALEGMKEGTRQSLDRLVKLLEKA